MPLIVNVFFSVISRWDGSRFAFCRLPMRFHLWMIYSITMVCCSLNLNGLLYNQIKKFNRFLSVKNVVLQLNNVSCLFIFFSTSSRWLVNACIVSWPRMRTISIRNSSTVFWNFLRSPRRLSSNNSNHSSISYRRVNN